MYDNPQIGVWSYVRVVGRSGFLVVSNRIGRLTYPVVRRSHDVTSKAL